jgi:hypothetical protein
MPVVFMQEAKDVARPSLCVVEVEPGVKPLLLL